MAAGVSMSDPAHKISPNTGRPPDTRRDFFVFAFVMFAIASVFWMRFERHDAAEIGYAALLTLGGAVATVCGLRRPAAGNEQHPLTFHGRWLLIAFLLLIAGIVVNAMGKFTGLPSLRLIGVLLSLPCVAGCLWVTLYFVPREILRNGRDEAASAVTTHLPPNHEL